jgi:hypothetical protein
MVKAILTRGRYASLGLEKEFMMFLWILNNQGHVWFVKKISGME